MKLAVRAIVIGLIAAILIEIPKWFWFNHPIIVQYTAYAVVGVMVLYIATARFLFERDRSKKQNYAGTANLLLQIHSVPAPGSGENWTRRGLFSFLLSFFGGNVGVEGAAAEAGHGFAVHTRSFSAQWFEQQRRTDAASALAAAIAGAFTAPFAAILIPMELSMGGRTRSVVLSALSSFLTVKYIDYFFQLPAFNLSSYFANFNFESLFNWEELTTITIVAIITGVLGWFTVWYFSYSKQALQLLFPRRNWLRVFTGGAFVALIIYVYPGSQGLGVDILDRILSAKMAPVDLGMLLLAKFLILSLIVSVLGSVGVFWPLFIIGSAVGCIVAQMSDSHLTLGIIAGGGALVSAVLGLPLAGGVLAYELSGNIAVLLPSIAVALLANQIRLWLKGDSLVHSDLTRYGFELEKGRELSALSSIPVKDVMVTDHVSVLENVSVESLYQHLLSSDYPYLPIVDKQDVYLGLITADIIEEAWAAQTKASEKHANAPLASLLEAKDLLYRTRLQVPTVNVTDDLSATTGIFDDTPVVPVLNEQSHVVGLLFSYNVRIAYDHEIAKRSFVFRWNAPKKETQ